ncbi:MAG: hypothetical protein JKY96_02035 [Phycisphaerales bacterium]|nr:hypothetical protein [Phycisphaerales bacterium]
MKFKSLILWSLLGCVGVAMVAGITAVVFPRLFRNDEVLATTIIVAAYALGGLVVLAVSRRMRWTLWLCSVCLIVSLVFFLIGVWFEQSMPYRLESFIWATGAASLTLGLTAVHQLLIRPLRLTTPLGKIIKYTALTAGVLTGAVIFIGFVAHGFSFWGRLHLRLMGVSAIVAGGTSIATGAMMLFGAKPGEDEPGMLVGTIPVSISCPRCAAGLTIDSNREGRCSACRLKIRVEVEEPRCSCGYLLFELAAEVCPECGKPISEHDRWSKSVEEAK